MRRYRIRLAMKMINASTIARPTRLWLGMATAKFSTLLATPEMKTPDNSGPRITINQHDGEDGQKADFDEGPKILLGLMQIVQHRTAPGDHA